jgi:hypothetical protein
MSHLSPRPRSLVTYRRLRVVVVLVFESQARLGQQRLYACVYVCPVRPNNDPPHARPVEEETLWNFVSWYRPSWPNLGSFEKQASVLQEETHLVKKVYSQQSDTGAKNKGQM